MDYPGHRVEGEKWRWRTLGPWIGPPGEITIMLSLMVAGYVLIQGLN